MLIVKELNCEFVVENRLGFLEGNTVLSEVRGGLGRVPFNPSHQYIVFMIDCVSSCAVKLSYAGEQPNVTGVLAVYPFAASEKVPYPPLILTYTTIRALPRRSIQFFEFRSNVRRRDC